MELRGLVTGACITLRGRWSFFSFNFSIMHWQFASTARWDERTTLNVYTFWMGSSERAGGIPVNGRLYIGWHRSGLLGIASTAVKMRSVLVDIEESLFWRRIVEVDMRTSNQTERDRQRCLRA